MSQQFYTLLTSVGKAKIAAANTAGTKVNLSTLKVGDGNGNYYEPTEAQVDLVHTVWQGNIGSIKTDDNNSNWIIIDTVIPSDAGGFTIREAGIFDDSGNLLAIAKYPETYKPAVEDGAIKDLTIEIIVEISNTANVTLKVNPNITLATQKDISGLDNKIKALSESTNETVKKNAEDIEELEGKVSSQLADMAKQPHADLQARKEIMGLELKLREQTALNALQKTGIGFYDTFADNSNIDDSATATYDSTNKLVQFTGAQTLKMKDENFDSFNNLELNLYPDKINKATIKGAVNNSTTVITDTIDKPLTVGDKLFMNNVFNEILNCTENYADYDHSTPVSVVNNAYATSATARPQVLSNGWIVTCVVDGSPYFRFFVSKDNGATWALLCYLGTCTGYTGWAMTSFGTEIYFLLARLDQIQFTKFDATNMIFGSLFNDGITIDTQTSVGSGCSIAISSTGVLTAAWCSKNSTYPNSFNIRSAKSVDGGVTWTKQDGHSGVDQVNTYNINSSNSSYPYVIYNKNGIPCIIFNWVATSYHTIYINIYNNGWDSNDNGSGKILYYNSTYDPLNPIATLQKYGTNAGRIWVTWYSMDSTDTGENNIRVSYSDDGGITWSTPTKLTSGNTYQQYSPTITSDINGNVYIMWYGITATNPAHFNIRQIMWNGTIWGSITEITSQNTLNIQLPSTCDNYYNFTNPITIWQDSQSTRIAFYGKFIAKEGYTLTMKEPTTLSDGDKISIADFSAKQDTIDLTLDSIDTEKFTFKGNSLNTTTAKISIAGKDNKLNALAYAIS